MDTQRPLALMPHLLIAAGILLSTLIAARAAGWWIDAAPVVLALAIVASGAAGARPGPGRRGPGAAAWVLAAACLLAGAIVLWRTPEVLATLLPAMGIGAWVTLRMGERRPSAPCGPR